MPGDTHLTSEGGEAAGCQNLGPILKHYLWREPKSQHLSASEILSSDSSGAVSDAGRGLEKSGYRFSVRTSLKLLHGEKPLGEGKGSQCRDGLGYVCSPSEP